MEEPIILHTFQNHHYFHLLQNKMYLTIDNFGTSIFFAFVASGNSSIRNSNERLIHKYFVLSLRNIPWLYFWCGSQTITTLKFNQHLKSWFPHQRYILFFEDYRHNLGCLYNLHCVFWNLPECWDRVPCRALTRVKHDQFRVGTGGATLPDFWTHFSSDPPSPNIRRTHREGAPEIC